MGAAGADVAADSAGPAVAAPVADVAGAAADTRASFAGAAVDIAVAAADAWAALAVAAADTTVAAADLSAASAAAAESAGGLYRRACRVHRDCGLHVPHSTRSGRRF